MKYQRSQLVGEAIERQRGKAYKAFNRALIRIDRQLPKLFGSLLKEDIENIAREAFLAGSIFEQEQELKKNNNNSKRKK